MRAKELAEKILLYESGEMEGDQIKALFQDLVKTGIVWQLDYRYIELANRLIKLGIVNA